LFSSSKAFSKSVIDSIGVENENGKKVILHKIEPKESYYALGRRYNVSVQLIMDYNKSILLQPSAIIKIPTQRDFVIQSAKIIESVITDLPKTSIHKVKSGETLYGIANKYQISVESLKTLNNLRSTSLNIGQQIKVPYQAELDEQISQKNKVDKETILEKPIQDDKENVLISDSTSNSEVVESPRNKYGITEMNDKGLAAWIENDDLDSSKSYALHKTAPIGTIIRITNPMTNKSVFAKVVGKFAENENTKDVIIVLTKTTAETIGAIDKRFLVTITFGIPNEQQ
jgi:LysM repeat protein